MNLKEIEIKYKRTKVPALKSITTSSDAVEQLRPFFEDEIDFRERVYALFLSQSNKPLAVFLCGVGGLAKSVVDAKQVFATAIKANTASMIIAHNHPSGNVRPSQADVDLTTRFRDIGKLLEINVIDHLILTSESYFSFADENKLY